jgi:hypothetical protein
MAQASGPAPISGYDYLDYRLVKNTAEQEMNNLP